MSIHLQRELDKLKASLLSLCAVVEGQVQMAVQALRDGDPELANRVEQRDDEVDRREVEFEEDCLRMLALYQPVAADLRLIVSALKINNDLERVGDLAVNIAHKAIALAHEPPIELPFDLEEMAAKSKAMLRDSLDALVNQDAQLANDVCDRDDEVDDMKRQVRVLIEKMLQDDPSRTKAMLKTLAVSRNLERIADCATNIAEDVVYLIEGKIIRHGEGE